MRTTVASTLAAAFAALGFLSCGGAGTGDDAVPDVAVDSGEQDVGDDIGAIDTIDDPGQNDGSGQVDAGEDVVEGGFGTECTGNDDCLSGYCVPSGRNGSLFCTQQCLDSCPDGFVCAPIASAGGDRLFLCLPEDDPTCTPCETALDCGSFAANCLPLVDGDFCITDCGPGGFCPDGTTCELRTIQGENRSLCLPPEEVCGACYDPDDDGHGLGGECEGEDCDQTDPLTYNGASELCDTVDNDCDLDVDEDFDLTTDRRNCGSCGFSCIAENSRSSCVDSACTIDSCTGGFYDCDLDPLTGCERPQAELNACGGCALLEGDPETACGTCGTGTWECNGLEDVRCVGDAGTDVLNACGGCETLTDTPGDVCGTCESGVLVCDGLDALVCAGDEGAGAFNACGGCATLGGVPDTACGTCGTGVWICDETERVVCIGDAGAAARNACGGCDVLDGVPGRTCGTCSTGSWLCATPDTLNCTGDLGAGALNACGGCTRISQTPGADCGTCGSGEWTCNGTDAITCAGDLGGIARNSCGGCATLEGVPGGTCGTCGTGRWGCNGIDDVECVGDFGAGAFNVCGGCDTLVGNPGQPCGSCGDGTLTCLGPDTLQCQGATGDFDNDTVCDSRDICPGGDDLLDVDRDGVPDFCDLCPADNPDDIDADGVCTSDDICPGGNDRRDTDFDGVPNDCDRCSAGSDFSDADGDSTPDACDCDSGLCDPRAACTERSTGVACVCNLGYTGTGRRCEDVDECDLQLDDCDPNYGSCENTDGDYTCTCLAGFDGTGQICTDIDECTRQTDLCVTNSTCQNITGGYLCPCNSGYGGNGLVSCDNVDECALGTDLCSVAARCDDANPGYTCTCNTGFRGNGFTCTDIDECDEGTDLCDINATCGNESGGYGCACRSGFAGDGFTCTPTGTTLGFPITGDSYSLAASPGFGIDNDFAYTVRIIGQTTASQAFISLAMTSNNLFCPLNVNVEVNDVSVGAFGVPTGQLTTTAVIGFPVAATGPEYRIRYRAVMTTGNCGTVVLAPTGSTIRLMP